MKALNKKLIRDLWQAKGQFLTVLIIVVLGVMLYSGINATFRNLSEASEKYYKEYRFGSLWVSFFKAPEGVEQKLGELPIVKMATGRIVQDVKLDISEENAVIRLITLPDTKKDIVDDIVMKSGRYFSDENNNQCLVEEEFFKANNLRMGDFIYPVINGSEIKLQVIGTVKSPEYVYTLKDSSELMPDNKRFGIVYVKKSFGEAVLSLEGSINNLSVLLEDGTDVENAEDSIRKELRQYGITSIVRREDQISNRMLSEEMKGLKSTGEAFPVVFFIVAAVIIYITMGRMVENQRTQIGVLKAFGFSNYKVLTHYLSFSAVIAVIGSILGSILGMFLGKGFTELENMYFNLPSADMKMYPDLVIPASALTLAFCLLAGYNACKRVFRITPSEAMRAKSPLKGRKILIERVTVLWNSISYSWKIILRNIFRYKRRALLTSVGVIFATAITIFAFGMKDSIDYLVYQQYSNIQNYDIKVNFSGFLNIDELINIKNIPHVAKIEPALEAGVEITNGWRKKDVGFTALIKNPEIYKVTDKKGNPVSLPDNGILIPEKLAKTLGVNINDTVDIKPFLPGKEEKEVQIKGIIAQYLGTSAYGNIDNINYILGEGRVVNSVLIRLDSPAFEKQVQDQLNEMPEVASVQSKSDSLTNLMKNMAAMSSSMAVMIILAAVLSIAVIYNITTINIFERQRELATLKVLGFKDKEVANLIFNENYLITFFGILVGLPFGRWLGTSMMSSYETDAYTIPFIAGRNVYIFTVIFMISFTVLANAILRKKIRKINMVEVLKSSE